ncbi:subtilisin-like protein [Penicillium longicatenatum]|uniref:subtilisin-like protein n=1 Tax=Penicillium longicatenatum TaxID=1561947 RepID=UPI0025488DBA|nr:subtilisin-like protein [Penicillium longicatenatum]KAJ5657424.1 subtilisin-like protein [Penicillium longicatenatum]
MKRHVERLKDRAKEAHYTLEVHVDSVWDYQTPHKDEPEDNLHTPKHRYLAHFDKYHTQLDNFANHSDNARLEQVEKFNRYSKPPRSLKEADPRIKVAIIDNGADINRSNLRKRIHAGVSYVSADKDQPQQPLPWWMVSDPHGTQMASLVEKVNPHCRLYIARVGKGRNDIKGYHAAKAIAWALEQNVDVISMSWTTTKEHEGLKNAVRQAAYSGNRRATLMFCSTADEGAFSGTIYPVHYKDHVIRVSATDDWGFQTSQSKGDSPADVLVPGEKAQAGGPGYIGNTQDTVSGSSVATALAAGLASLALLLLRTRNGEDKRMREFYTKLGMMKVFNKMRAEENGVLKLSTLFPIAENPDMALWDIENFLD